MGNLQLRKCLLLAIFRTVLGLKCNGMEGLCRLTLDQVTLAGTHNSGAGFNGHLKYHSALGPVLAGSCWYRSQGKSITQQLEFGIRYFDIDTCWEDNGSRYLKGAWSCHADAYGGPAKKILEQADEWMNREENRNEVIVIHFNRDIEKGKEKQIGKDLIKLLKEFWEPTPKRIAAGKLSMQDYIKATLGDSVRQNKRVYVIFHQRLISSDRPRYLHGEWYVGYTWKSQGLVGSNSCKALATAVADNCKREVDYYRIFIRLDLFLTWGLCLHHLADTCNNDAPTAVQRCYKNTMTKGKTVNFIVVDYPSRGGHPNIVELARKQNLINIKRYSKRYL